MALIGMSGDARIELATGTVWQAEDGYQHLELIGSRGRILRPSDGASPAVLLDRGNGWETVSCKEKDMGLETAHALSAQYFAHRIDDHPMSLAHALPGYALMMAVYESARRNARLDLPCKMADDPLRKMLQDGRLE